MTTVLSVFHLIDWCAKFAISMSWSAAYRMLRAHLLPVLCWEGENSSRSPIYTYSFPMCREANFKTIAHHEANRAIKELLIYCPNNKEGWGKHSWTGALGGLNRHLKDCKVECRKCVLSLGYHAMRRHLTTLRSSVAVWW